MRLFSSGDCACGFSGVGFWFVGFYPINLNKEVSHVLKQTG
jgi:hypothetical protein